MGRAKLPRKSTNIDMTAMCDVAFLLLSFFILATKTKPPEAVAVVAPSSVSTKAAPEKSLLITFTKDAKVFFSMGDETKKMAILENLNTLRNLGLTPGELQKLRKMEFYGMPVNQIKGYLALSSTPSAAKMPGIPVDSTNNELSYWLASSLRAYGDLKQSEFDDMIMVKGDLNSKYPVFKDIKQALKSNEIFRFKIVTNSETIPHDSELYIQSKSEKK